MYDNGQDVQYLMLHVVTTIQSNAFQLKTLFVILKLLILNTIKEIKVLHKYNPQFKATPLVELLIKVYCKLKFGQNFESL